MVSAYTNVDLRHAGGTFGGGTLYWVTPIQVRRPVRGCRIVEVRCGGCDALVRTRIYSARHTLWARCWRLLMTLAAAGGLAVLLGVMSSMNGASVEGRVWLFILAMIVLSSTAIGGTILYYNEDGVRLGWRSGHRLKRGLARKKA